VRPRFYAPGLDPSAERVPLPAEEAEHLTRVLRLGAGALVQVIDGRGGLWSAEVIAAGKRSATVRLIDREPPAAESRVPITLVMSVLKADKMDDVVRDAVMLGVIAIQPVISERAEIRMATLVKSERVARWQRIAVSSAKQCGRAVVPAIREAMPIDWYWTEATDAVRLMCVEPSAALGQVASVQNVPKPRAADVIVGPEGGWTVPEVAAAHASGVILMSLGGRTLRADAVPIVALTALLTAWSELT
jgi:16S rRNA (uracil1498-N3)-methyltransferase